jgi:hypothetical protein
MKAIFSSGASLPIVSTLPLHLRQAVFRLKQMGLQRPPRQNRLQGPCFGPPARGVSGGVRFSGLPGAL